MNKFVLIKGLGFVKLSLITKIVAPKNIDGVIISLDNKKGPLD